MATTVVHVRHELWDVYIGRQSPRGDGYFGNPFQIREMGRKLCLVKYRNYFEKKIAKDPEFVERLQALKDKRLGCYCKPTGGFGKTLLCHGQIIAGYLDGIDPREVE